MVAVEVVKLDTVKRVTAGVVEHKDAEVARLDALAFLVGDAADDGSAAVLVGEFGIDADAGPHVELITRPEARLRCAAFANRVVEFAAQARTVNRREVIALRVDVVGNGQADDAQESEGTKHSFHDDLLIASAESSGTLINASLAVPSGTNCL